MDEILKPINANQLWLFIIGIASPLSILISLFLYYKSAKKGKLIYGFNHFNIFDQKKYKIPEFNMTYDNSLVKNLSATTFCIINYGNKTISKEDIPKLGGLKICFPESSKILKFQELYIKNTTNNFSVSKIDEKNLEIKFDFMDRYDGIIIRVFHEEKDVFVLANVECHGYVKDSGKILRVSFKSYNTVEDIVENIRSFFYTFIYLVGCVYFIIQLTNGSKYELGTVIFLTTSIIFSFLGGIVMMWLSYVNIFKSYYLPKGYEIYRGES